MRIAYDCRELTRPTLSALALVLLSIMKSSDDHEYLLLSDVPLDPRFVPENATNLAHGRRNNGGGDVLRYHWWLRKTLNREAPDVFYEVDHYLLFRSKKTRQIATIHDVYVMEGLEPYALHHRLAYRLFINRTRRNADLIHVPSNFTKNRLDHHFGHTSNVLVRPIGMDPPETTSVRPEGVSDRFILVLGRISEWKGSARIAELFAKYLSGHGVQLVFAGRCDPREKRVGETISSYCEKYRDIIWINYVSAQEREWLLKNTALLCYASRYDGFGMPPVEAALRRTPCLMNDTPVLREVTKGLGAYVDFFGDDEPAVSKIRHLLAGGEGVPLDQLIHVGEQYTWSGYLGALLNSLPSTSPSVNVEPSS